ncbi:MAG: alkyl hydroperoxide reductase [Fimbriiglobus sp.]
MTPTAPKWMSAVLLLAAAYNLMWGAWVVLFPGPSFELSGMMRPGEPLDYPPLWQCIGMIVGVYGIGYLAAARDPARHWPVVLVGFLGKLFGPIGLAFGVATGESRPEGLFTILPNDLIWWVPFALILRHAYRVQHPEAAA